MMSLVLLRRCLGYWVEAWSGLYNFQDRKLGTISERSYVIEVDCSMEKHHVKTKTH